MDSVSREKRSLIMSRIRSHDTKPELHVRSYFFRQGLRYTLKSTLPGKPDMVFESSRSVLFVHGCFWHHHDGCAAGHLPKTNTDYWRRKFAENAERDAMVQRQLEALGYRVFVIWECEHLNTMVLDGIIGEIRERRRSS